MRSNLLILALLLCFGCIATLGGLSWAKYPEVCAPGPNFTAVQKRSETAIKLEALEQRIKLLEMRLRLMELREGVLPTEIY